MTNRTATYKLELKHDQFIGALKVAQSEVDNLAKGLSARLGSAGAVLEKLGPYGMAAAAGIGAIVAAAGGLAKAARDAADFGGRINDLSLKTGISTTALQKLEHAGRLSGASLEQLTGAVNKMQKELVTAPKSFDALGLSATKLKAMEPDKALAAVAAQLQRIQNPAQQAAAAMAVFGKSGAELLPVLKGDLAAAGEEAERLGMILGGDTIKALDDFGDSTDTLTATWGGLWKQLGAAVATTPAVQKGIKDLTEAAGDFAKTLVENKAAIQGFVTLLSDMVKLAAKPIIFTVKVVGGAASGLGLDKSAGLYSTLFGAAGDWLSSALGGPETLAQQKAKHDLMMRQLAAGAGADRAPKAGGGGGPTFDPDALKELHAAIAAALKKANEAVLKYADAWLEAVDDFASVGSRGGPDFLSGAMLAHPGTAEIFGTAQISGLLDTPGSNLTYAGMMSAWKAKYPNNTKPSGGGAQAAEAWDVQLQRLAHTMAALGPLTAGFVGKLVGMMGAIASIGANLRTLGVGGEGKGGFSKFLGGMGAIGGIAAAGIGFISGLFGGGAQKREEQKRAQDDALSQIKALADRWDQFKRDTVLKGAAGFSALMEHMASKTKLTAEEMKRLGVIGMAVFGSLRKAGMSIVDALREMGPALAGFSKRSSQDIEKLRAEYERLTDEIAMKRKHGKDTSALELTRWQIGKEIEKGEGAPDGPFAELSKFAALVEANESLVRAAEGLGDALNGLRVTGNLTVETFSAIQEQAGAMFGELTEKGFTTDQALAVMARTLFMIKQAAEKGGFAIDAETQKLIDMAEQAGLFEDLQDPMEAIKEILELQLIVTAALVKAFGVDLPAAAQKYIDKLNEIPAIPGPPNTGNNNGPGDTDQDDNRKGYALGGYVSPRPGGTVVRVGEGGEGEHIVRDSQVGAFIARFTNNDAVVARLDSIERLMRSFPTLARDQSLMGRA